MTYFTSNRSIFFKVVIILPVVILILFLFNISLGSVSIPLPEVAKALFTGSAEKESWLNIILHFRLPKALTALLAGAALGVSGLQMQTLFRNPLAGPYVLGISSGASLGVALVVLLNYSVIGIFTSLQLNNWVVIIASSIGSFIVLICVSIVSLKVRDSMTLLIVGLMFGSIAGAAVSVLQFFSDAKQLQIYMVWTFGSLGGLGWDELKILCFFIVIGLLISVISFKPLNTLLLSENYARTMGLNVTKARILIILSTSLLAGGITAFCGPIAFIGLAVPHLTRLVFNTSDHKVLIPAVALSGIIIMLFCDTVAQLPSFQSVLPINAVTSLIGAPVVIWLIVSTGGIKNSFHR